MCYFNRPAVTFQKRAFQTVAHTPTHKCFDWKNLSFTCRTFRVLRFQKLMQGASLKPRDREVVDVNTALMNRL